MQKPENWDSTPAKEFTGFDQPNCGGHLLRIVDVMEGRATSSGRSQLAVMFDIAAGPYKDHYTTLSNKLGKPCFPCLYWGTEGDSIPYLKGNIQTVEASNPGYIFNWDERTLIGKLVGGNLREEEYAKDGDIKTSIKIAWLCKVSEIPNQKVLAVKKFNPPQRQGQGARTNTQSQGFSDGVPLPTESDLPF